jgi:hypothetical protein
MIDSEKKLIHVCFFIPLLEGVPVKSTVAAESSGEETVDKEEITVLFVVEVESVPLSEEAAAAAKKMFANNAKTEEGQIMIGPYHLTDPYVVDPTSTGTNNGSMRQYVERRRNRKTSMSDDSNSDSSSSHKKGFYTKYRY